MLDDPLFYVVVAAVLLVLFVLLLGLACFTKGGDFNRKYANKIMRARIAAQAVAVLLIVVYVFLRGRGG